MIGVPCAFDVHAGRARAVRLDTMPSDRTVLPPADSQCWARILTGELDPDIKTLATRLIITRLRIEVTNNSTALPRSVDDLRRFFAENKFAHRDLATIIGA